MRVDVHQHVWTESLLAALSKRTRRPYVRRAAEGWVLRLEGEPPYPLGDDEDVFTRTRLFETDGIDRALVAPSLSLGFDSLPSDEARHLLDAHEDGALDLPPDWGAWGTVMPGAGANEVERLLGLGFAGICLPATALATPSGLERHQDVLAALEAADAPLFIHPGAVPLDQGDAEVPEWWHAMTSYVAQMNTAWHSYVTRGTAQHPRLRVLFAMLAGGAPLHGERLATRGGRPPSGADDRLFYDVSSYGPRAIRAMSQWVGKSQLVHGSDRPLAAPEPVRVGALRTALRTHNPARLFAPSAVAA